MNKLKDDIHKDKTTSLDAMKTNFESKELAFDEIDFLTYFAEASATDKFINI